MLAQSDRIRLLIAIVESPPVSTPLDPALQPIVELCWPDQLRVLVLDPAGANSRESNPALLNHAKATGGLLIRDPRFLDRSIVALSAVAVPPKELPVTKRFIRSSSQGPQSYGVECSFSRAGPGGGINPSEGGSTLIATSGRMRGMFLVECRLSGLRPQGPTRPASASPRLREMARAPSPGEPDHPQPAKYPGSVPPWKPLLRAATPVSRRRLHH